MSPTVQGTWATLRRSDEERQTKVSIQHWILCNKASYRKIRKKKKREKEKRLNLDFKNVQILKAVPVS